MIQKIVDILIDKQLQHHTVTDEDEKIYRYGYILLCEVILNLILALIIGIIFSKIKEIIFFLGVYIPLRSFCGGWHADRIWKCTWISNGILLLLVYGIEKVMNYLSISGMLVIFFLNMVCVFFLAPVETKMKQISQEEKQVYRRKIKLILVIHLITMIIITQFDVNDLVFSMMLVYIVQNVMLVLEIIKQKRLSYKIST